MVSRPGGPYSSPIAVETTLGADTRAAKKKREGEERQLELWDRMQIRELTDRYARSVDRRDFERLASLFTADARVAIHSGQAPDGALQAELLGRDSIVDALRGIARFEATTHFVGNQLVSLSGSVYERRASAETYALAAHLSRSEQGAHSRVVALRYQDRLVCERGSWLFEERVLSLDWDVELPASLPATLPSAR